MFDCLHFTEQNNRRRPWIGALHVLQVSIANELSRRLAHWLSLQSFNSARIAP